MGRSLPWLPCQREAAECNHQTAWDESGAQHLANGEAYPLFSVGDCRSVSPFPSDQLGISQTESTYPASERYKDKACVYPGIWVAGCSKTSQSVSLFGRHRTLYPYGDTTVDYCPFDFYHLPADRRTGIPLAGLYLESDSENLCGYNRLCPQSVYNCCYLVCGEVSGTYGALSGSWDRSGAS